MIQLQQQIILEKRLKDQAKELGKQIPQRRNNGKYGGDGNQNIFLFPL